jgi:Domain of unknown function (DUF4062)
MAAEFRVFLSAVTSEFGAARDAVANDLQARDVQVRVQRSFRQEAESDTLLRLLHDYIAGCNAVVCVIGRRSGGCPPPAAAAAFAHMLPPGISEASYTQWEFFFARAHKRRLSLYLAEPDYGLDEPTGNDFPGLQEAFIGHIKAEGLHRVPFSNRDQLRAEVLKEDWPRKPPVKPILLPYPSLGTLFKGRAAFIERVRESLNGGPTEGWPSLPRRFMDWAASAKRARRSNTPGPSRRSTPRSSSSSPIRPRPCREISRRSPVSAT